MTEEQTRAAMSDMVKNLMNDPEFIAQCTAAAQSVQNPGPAASKSDKKSKKKDKKKKDKKKKRNKTLLGAGILLGAGGLTYCGVKYYKKHKDSENEGATSSFRI